MYTYNIVVIIVHVDFIAGLVHALSLCGSRWMAIMGKSKATIGDYINTLLSRSKRREILGDMFLLTVDFQQAGDDNKLASSIRDTCGNVDTSSLYINVQGEKYNVGAFILGNRFHYKSVVKVGKYWHLYDPLASTTSTILSTGAVKKLYSFKDLHSGNKVGITCPECIFFLKKAVVERMEREYEH